MGVSHEYSTFHYELNRVVKIESLNERIFEETEK